MTPSSSSGPRKTGSSGLGAWPPARPRVRPQAVAGRLGHRRLGVLPPAVRRPGGERAAHLGHLAHHVVERGVVGDLVHGGAHPECGRQRDRLDERVPQVHLAADRRGVPHQRDEREAVRGRGLQHHLERLEAVGVDQLLGQPAGVVGCERGQGALVDLPGLGAGPERGGGLPRAVEVVVGEVRRRRRTPARPPRSRSWSLSDPSVPPAAEEPGRSAWIRPRAYQGAGSRL